MKKIKEIFNRLTMGRALMLGLALAGLYYYALFDSGQVQIAAITAGESHTAEVTAKIEANQKMLDRAEVFKKTAAEVGTTIRKLLALIPQKFGVADLERIVSNEAKNAGSSLLTILPKEIKVSDSAKEFEELSLSVDLQGSFLQHMIFLSNLTKVKQILIIRKFDFTLVKEGHGDEPNIVKMVAEIVAYRYRGQDKPADKTGTPGAGEGH